MLYECGCVKSKNIHKKVKNNTKAAMALVDRLKNKRKHNKTEKCKFNEELQLKIGTVQITAMLNNEDNPSKSNKRSPSKSSETNPKCRRRSFSEQRT